MSTSPAAPPNAGVPAPVQGNPAPAPAPAAPVAPAPPVQGAAQGTIGSAGNKMPNRGRRPVATALPGLPPMLELVSNQSYSTEQQRIVSQFVPSAAHMFHVVHEMDQVMTMTDRFTRGNHAWVPVMTHYYISIMWYFMVMTIASEAGILDQATLQFLNVCQQLFDFRSLLIPGPLVPFFEALATCSAHFNWYGDISPNLPTITELDMSVANRFHIDQQWLRLLPNPLFSYEGIRRFAMYATTIHDYPTASQFHWYRGAFGTNTQAANNEVYVHFMAPNGIASVVPTTAVTTNAYQYWHGRASHMFCAQFTQANAVPVSSWPQFFGFVGSNGNDNFNVWNTTTPVMQTYCSFFHGSRSLATISPTGLGAIIPRGIVSNYNLARTYFYPEQDELRSFENRQFGRRFDRNLTVIHRHPDHTLPELAEQYAALTGVHLSLDGLASQHGWTQINQAQQRIGPFWNVVTIRNSIPLQVWFGYGQMVSGRYHSSTSLAIN